MKVKLIKLKKRKGKSVAGLMTVQLHDWVIKMTNCKMISVPLHRHIQKFVYGLEQIPLSEELQGKNLSNLWRKKQSIQTNNNILLTGKNQV